MQNDREQEQGQSFIKGHLTVSSANEGWIYFYRDTLLQLIVESMSQLHSDSPFFYLNTLYASRKYHEEAVISSANIKNKDPICAEAVYTSFGE